MAKAKTEVTYKYGVAWLAKTCKLQPTSVRVALRKLSVKKTKEGVYGWNSEADAKKVANKITDAGRSEAPAKKAA